MPPGAGRCRGWCAAASSSSRPPRNGCGSSARTESGSRRRWSITNRLYEPTLLPAFGDRELEAITPEEIELWRRGVQEPLGPEQEQVVDSAPRDLPPRVDRPERAGLPDRHHPPRTLGACLCRHEGSSCAVAAADLVSPIALLTAPVGAREVWARTVRRPSHHFGPRVATTAARLAIACVAKHERGAARGGDLLVAGALAGASMCSAYECDRRPRAQLRFRGAAFVRSGYSPSWGSLSSRLRHGAMRSARYSASRPTPDSNPDLKVCIQCRPRK
jgi:hypothetical protein